jgi:predicted RND superfamily exporter protein
MWYNIGRLIIKNRVVLMIVLIITTAFMAWKASKVQLSYDFSRAIPTENIKYQQFQQFKQKFGDDGNMMVLGIEDSNYFSVEKFNAVAALENELKRIPGVQSVLSIPSSILLVKSDTSEKISSVKIFHYPYTQQSQLDADAAVFNNQLFYKGLLYNSETRSYLVGLKLNKDSINSKARTHLVGLVRNVIQQYSNEQKQLVHLSGLPFIRTTVGDRIAKEMNLFLIGSLLLSAITLLLFFRSVSATIMSLLVVGMGVVWCLGTIVLFGYKITLLTALIPPLIVVIGIPNCIYFLNKYHATFKETGDKNKALVTMVGRMGIVTLFCNIAAAIGFAVFSFTSSALLKEFGVVAGINIMVLYLISLVFIPVVLSYLPVPGKNQLRYLDNKLLEKFLVKVESWSFNHQRAVITTTIVLTAFAAIGITRLKSEAFIVDDLPRTDAVYTDLKWFENNFDGVMPLEILVDTKKRNGLTRSLQTIEKIDSFSQYIAAKPETARPLSFVEGLKFVRQAYYDNDSTNYLTPTEFDVPVLGKYIKTDKTKTADNELSRTLTSFIDTAKQVARISVNMKDIGSVQLPLLLNEMNAVAAKTFDTSKYNVTFTGSSVTFLEGSHFIINGLKESILWAFLLITLCMLYLFRSFRILVCSLIPNLVPLIITAGLMGWVGIRLKPSTVLVFSVALGIAIDVTIRFLINYKQELPDHNGDVPLTLKQTISHTGLSIVYTSLVLIAGFVIFCFSDFGGTKSLGWLTSFTLVTGTITNLVLLPVLLLKMSRKKAAE